MTPERRAGPGTVSMDDAAHGLPAFDLDDPLLPDWVAAGALSSGGFPYDKQMKRGKYEAELHALQVELVRLLASVQAEGGRVVVLFEGRDAAGKGDAIKVFREFLNPRHARIVALPRPSDRERGQWYFQRYVEELPAAGEMVLFDRSWYNRGVVEPVMGFCTPEEAERFLDEAPRFERLLAESGIRLFKFWLTIGREMQLKRFHDRRHDPLKAWKISPVDVEAISRWDAFTQARDRMIEATHTAQAPWTVVRANDKRRARIEIIRHVLMRLPYAGRDEAALGAPDPNIVAEGPALLTGGRKDPDPASPVRVSRDRESAPAD
jgi:polyphosphate kinase